MNERLRVLVVEDSEDDTALIERELRRHGFAPALARVDTPEALHAALDTQGWDVVVSDYSMPRFSGVDALRTVREKGLDIPFIIVSGSIGEETAVEAMKRGAQDYIMKDRMARLAPAIERELEEAETRRERRRAEERVRYLAYYDPLTELPNRVQFLEQLDGRLHGEGRTDQPAALLLLDLDHFREINDTLGHQNGDSLLREAATRLRRVMRRSDLAARLGGDDFALLLSPANAAYARQVAEQLHAAMLQPFDVAGFSLALGAKTGIALYPQHSTDAHQLLQHADVALSLAMAGTSGFALYDAIRDPSNPRRLLLMSDLRAAIGSDQLQPYFQPKVGMRTGRVTGVEALVRWVHPERGPIPPDEFIPLAEMTGVIKPLTLRMLETSMERSYEWRLRGQNVPVAINLSVKDLLDQSLIQKVEALLLGRAMEPGMLELEITEGVLMEDPVRALEILEALSDMHIRLSIDDFGTGYSSLAYLQRLPVNAVKIDKSFVVDMLDNSEAATIVRSIIDLAHNLDMKVVAEGVEDRPAWERLAQYGCDEAQGYYIARPLPAPQFEEWLRAGAGAWRPGE